MSEKRFVTGQASALRIDNLDTDQIMPKQFLRGIDKSGLVDGLLYDLRFDKHGGVRPEFVLNKPERAGTSILIGGANFGCGSSREHAVWGLLQYGIQAVVAPSFGEIFYSNAMGNRLLLVQLNAEDIEAMMALADRPDAPEMRIDVASRTVSFGEVQATFPLSQRHQTMFLQGVDVIGLSLSYQEEIDAFAKTHWEQQPWVRDVARRMKDRMTAVAD
ncbi:3-isopropylmalate dehydratase small subunit [Pigmentiphaga aceris]|uniref:3-isopropylmalate dehydratase small subunit n=1 Tax=Pigmentiphaga aceris TaxID=1940612 RepID=A0A5C0B4K8_9BURK|nr:3-isopropylmalate dehydratase small subunit [Pigmentiphaga aceris]QEI08593.1 3-isopropylmalate dehydratase small subunit [Pigmentiphaga aceris]